MSADRTLCFLGVRICIEDEDVQDEIEEQKYPLVVAVRQQKLQCYYGTFNFPDNEYYLYIGCEYGILGREGISELSIDLPQLQAMLESIAAKLRTISIYDVPKLFVHFQLDN